MITQQELDDMLAVAQAATPTPWEFRATEHSGGIRFVVAPNAPRNTNGTEFIPADCSHGYNGTFIVSACNNHERLIEEVRNLHKSLRDVRAIVDEGIENYCDVNPEDCDHCVALAIIDDALEGRRD